MADQYFLYTVTGLREPFYAAVDHETGRAWTSPTKDGAIRQAREEGIEGFVERKITREKFLRSLGIEAEPARRIHKEPAPAPPVKPPAPRSIPAGSWFVTDAQVLDDNANGKTVSFPAWLKNHKPAKVPKNSSPFAASEISPPSGDIVTEPEDMIIIPSKKNGQSSPNPFTDSPAAPLKPFLDGSSD